MHIGGVTTDKLSGSDDRGYPAPIFIVGRSYDCRGARLLRSSYRFNLRSPRALRGTPLALDGTDRLLGLTVDAILAGVAGVVLVGIVGEQQHRLGAGFWEFWESRPLTRARETAAPGGAAGPVTD